MPAVRIQVSHLCFGCTRAVILPIAFLVRSHLLACLSRQLVLLILGGRVAEVALRRSGDTDL